jgi:hypothetical protein
MIKLEWIAEKVSMAGFHLTEWPAVTPSSFVLVYFEPGTGYLAASSVGQERVSKGLQRINLLFALRSNHALTFSRMRLFHPPRGN